MVFFVVYMLLRKKLLKLIYMKKFIFTAICGVTVFIMLLTTAYGNVEPCNVSNDEDIIYTTDPLDEMLAKIEMENSM